MHPAAEKNSDRRLYDKATLPTSTASSNHSYRYLSRSRQDLGDRYATMQTPFVTECRIVAATSGRRLAMTPGTVTDCAAGKAGS